MNDVDNMWAIFSDAKQQHDHELHQENQNIENFLKEQNGKVAICISCGEEVVDQHVSDGFLVCTNCGVVQDSFIDSSAEWRCFSNASGGKDVSGVRCGDVANSLLPGTQLNTYIGGKDKRLQRVHQWTNLSSKERNLHQIYKEFEQIGMTNNLSKLIVSSAADLYSKLYTEMENKNCGVKRCNVRQGLKAACLYFACKQLSVPRERKEIADMLGNTTKIVTKGCNSFLDIMGGDYVKMDPFKPEDFVARFSQMLSIPYQYQHKLEAVVEYVASLDILADNTPTSVTSACIYFISIEYELGLTKDEIHEKCGSSQIIITKTYNKILPFREDILKILHHT